MTTRTAPEGDRAAAQFRDQMHTLKEDVGQMGRLAKSAAAETMEDVKDKAREYMQTGREKTEKYEDALLRKVRSHPLESVAIAAGIGFVLGFLNRRRP